MEISLRKAALIAGLGVLVMALTVPIAEFYIFPELIDYSSPMQTRINIEGNPRLFSIGILIHLVSVICDVIIAWALYHFLKPTDKSLAMLATFYRLVYTAFNITALSSLIHVLAWLNTSKGTGSSAYLDDSVFYNVQTFHLQWRFGLIFFGIYLCLLSWVCLKSAYIPRVVSYCVLVAGLGYLAEDLKYFLYPNYDTGFLWFTFFGELVFMFWLIFKGGRYNIGPLYQRS